MVPARPCGCIGAAQVDRADLGVPSRYREATLESFWEWWKLQHPRDKVMASLQGARQLLEHRVTRETLGEELRSRLDLVLHRCGPSADGAWKDLRPAQEPQGYRNLVNWARHDRDLGDAWWIDGPSGSGRSTLAAATLRAWSERRGKAGLYVSVRTFSQELKDTYYDTRSFRNTDFLSERDRMAPLLRAPLLVLDDLDRMDSDIRVVRSFGQLLDQRHADQLPTLVTASRWAESLQALERDQYPLLRLEDPSLLRRLAQSKRVVLRPTLDRLLDTLNG